MKHRAPHVVALAAIIAMLVACAGGVHGPTASDASALVDPEVLLLESTPVSDYRIGIGDLLAVSVFQMSDLSAGAARVDTAGVIQLPLLGETEAAGRTAPELAEEVRSRLAARYLQNPQVTVSVNEVARQKVTVDGSVTKPGVFEMKGSTTLMQAIAMAEGPTRTAALDQIVVFRTVNGQRMVAKFDLAAIRAGRANDPHLQGDDVVVVDSSRLKAAWRDIIAALPGLAIFQTL